MTLVSSSTALSEVVTGRGSGLSISTGSKRESMKWSGSNTIQAEAHISR